MQHSVKTYVRFYKKVTHYTHPLKEFVDVDIVDLGVRDIAALHDMIRKDDTYCAYNTFQISILHDGNGLEHRSAPINESRMIKFGEIKPAHEVKVPVYTGWMIGQLPYSDQHPESRGKSVVICGGNICPVTAGDIVYDRESGQKIWPVPAPRVPGPQP
jgi:hypothetical protein